MLYYIDAYKLLINIRKHYKLLLESIDKDILDDFIDNCATNTSKGLFINIKYVNKFRHIYKDEFDYIMKITDTDHV